MAENLIPDIADLFGGVQQVLGEPPCLAERGTNKIPGPQPEDCGKSILIESGLFAQLERPRIRVLYLFGAQPLSACSELPSDVCRSNSNFFRRASSSTSGMCAKPWFRCPTAALAERLSAR